MKKIDNKKMNNFDTPINLNLTDIEINNLSLKEKFILANVPPYAKF